MNFALSRPLQVVMLALGIALVVVPMAQAQQYSFETIAGSFDGDGGQARDAHLMRPSDVVFDAAGNMLISDAGRHRIRKVTPAGVVTTLVGNGVAGYSGDGASDPSNSRIHAPGAMVLDAAGNLYFSDTNNHRVRKLGVDGSLTLVAGNGSPTVSGDGGLAVAAGLRSPESLALDTSGNLYVSQISSHRVRKIDLDGRISTFAGTGASSGGSGDGGPANLAVISFPSGLDFDVAGNLLMAEHGNDRIRSVSPLGIITTFAAIYAPWDLLADAKGGLYVASYCSIHKIDPQGNQIILAGNPEGPCRYSGDGGPASEASVFYPEGMSFGNDGSLVFADVQNGRVRRIAQGDISTLAGRGTPFGDGGPAANAGFTSIVGVGLATDGRVFVADAISANRIRVISPGGQVNTIAGHGEEGVSDGDGGPATQAGVYQPYDAAMDGAGNLYIAEYQGGNVRRVSPNGIIDTVMSHSEGIGLPRSLAVDSAGNLYVADLVRRRVFKRTASGIVSVFAGTGIPGSLGDGGLATNASVFPNAVAADRFGNVFIAEDSGRIRKVTGDGIITTVAGNGPLQSSDSVRAIRGNIGYPRGVAVASNGDLYIAAGELRKVTSGGTVSTVAGLPYPAYDVAVADDGTIYVASLGGRVLKGTPLPVSFPGPLRRVMPKVKAGP